MPEVAYIRPGGDPAADDLARWGGYLRDRLAGSGHPPSVDVSFESPADRLGCELAMSAGLPLIVFCGHGDSNALLGSSRQSVIDESNLALAAWKTIVSVACEAGRVVGPAAIQAGVRAHVGWDVLLLWLSSDVTAYGEAIVEPLADLGGGASVSEVADALGDRLNGVAQRHRVRSPYDSNAKLAYYAAAAAAGQITIHGDRHVRPLAGGLSSVIRVALWRAGRLGKAVTNSIRGVGHGR